MRYSIKIVASILMALSLSFGCAWEGDLYAPRILTGSILSDQKWEAFLQEIPRYSELSENPLPVPSLELGIAKEWNQYKPSVSTDTWHEFLFDDGLAPTLTSEEMEYVDYMEQVTPLVDIEWNWDYEEPKEESVLMMADQAKLALDKAENVRSNAFLTQRYVFQSLRLYRYAGMYDSVEAVTERTQWEKGQQTLTYWRMKALVAGVLRKEKKDGEAMAMFADVANNSPELIFLGYRNCKFIENWQAGLAAAKDSGSKAMVLFTQMVYQDKVDPESIKHLAALEPASSRLEVAFLKQVAAYEREFWRPGLASGHFQCADSSYAGEELWKKVTTSGSTHSSHRNFFLTIWDAILHFFTNLFGLDENNSQDKGALGFPPAVSFLQCGSAAQTAMEQYSTPEEDSTGAGDVLRTLAIALAGTETVPNKALYSIAAAQLSLMLNDYPKVHQYSEQAVKVNASQGILQAATLLNTLATLEQNGVTSDAFQKDANAFLASKPDTVARNLFFEQTGKAYLKDFDFVKATAAMWNREDDHILGKILIDMVLTVPELDSLEAARNQASTPYEKALYAHLPSSQDFAELAGNKFLRVANFDEATKRFLKNGENYWIQKYQNDAIYSRHVFTTQQGDLGQGPQSIEKMSRLEFARKIQTLAKKNDYKSLMTIGNLFYWDWGWHYSDRLWEGYQLLYAARDMSGGNSELYANSEVSVEVFNRIQMFMANYSVQQMAARYYELAMLAAKNDGDRADAMYAFTLAKNANWTSAENVDPTSNHKAILFELLRSHVKEQGKLEEFAGRCTELLDFLNR